MDNIQDRLKTTTDALVKAYDAWFESKKDGKTRGDLQEAIHELRKAASRVEIDMAVSERDQNAQKVLPIPQNRASQGGGHSSESILSDDGGGNGNDDRPQKQDGGNKQRRRRPAKRAQ